MMNLFNTLFIIFAFMLLINNTAYARRGCCSWHGGVASCDTNVGRLICRDGTYSPSCTCEMTQPMPEKSNNINNDKLNTDSDMH